MERTLDMRNSGNQFFMGDQVGKKFSFTVNNKAINTI